MRWPRWDAGGRSGRVLAGGERGPGMYGGMGNGQSGRARAVASGVYFDRLEVGDWSRTRKMLLIR